VKSRKRQPEKDYHRGVTKTLRASAEQWERWGEEARAEGLPLQEWIRRRADRGGEPLESPKEGLDGQ
jgi:hypothetical protein